MLFETFYPDTWVDSTYQIDFDELYKKGYRGLIFDIDNTLVPHGEPADERAKALFAHLKELGFFLLSVVEQSAGACADVQQRCAGALYRGCT